MADGGDARPISIVWIEGGGCDGCTMSVLGATSPRIEEFLAGGLTRRAVQLHHPLLAADAGAAFMTTLHAAADGRLDPFVLVVEGSLYDEPLVGATFSRLGPRPASSGEAPATVAAWVERLAPRAAAVIAIGSCAAFGGIPAAQGGVTGAHGVDAHLGREFRTTAGLPVVDLPGCAPSGDAFVETLSFVVLHLEGLVPLELDEQRRPRWLYREETPLHRVGELPSPSDARPAVTAACPVPTRGWINRLGGCAVVGGACNGCTRPDFPDRTLPLLVGGSA